jgi:hypothetical protein
MRKGIRLGLASVLAAGLLTAGMSAAPAAFAKGREVIKTGSCSASSDWKLKTKADDGRLEVEFEVDSNVNGQTWKVTLSDNGTTVFKGTRVTKAPSGSFEVEKRIANQPGTDMIKGRATNPASGETCVGSLSF